MSKFNYIVMYKIVIMRITIVGSGDPGSGSTLPPSASGSLPTGAGMDHDARSSHHGEGVPAGAAGSAAGSAGAGLGGPGGPEGMRGLPAHGGPPGMGNVFAWSLIEFFYIHVYVTSMHPLIFSFISDYERLRGRWCRSYWSIWSRTNGCR